MKTTKQSTDPKLELVDITPNPKFLLWLSGRRGKDFTDILNSNKK